VRTETSSSHASAHFDGGANFDEVDFPTKGFAGLTLRLYDTEREEYWASRRTGVLFPPVVGRFTDGRGEFRGEDGHAGRPVHVRFVWSGITDRTAHWEQAFSTDGGATWLVNWTMSLTRR